MSAAHTKQFDELMAGLSRLAGISVENVIREKELGSVCFEELRPDIVYAVEGAKEAIRLSEQLRALPRRRLAVFLGAVNTCMNTFSELARWQQAQPQQRDSLVNDALGHTSALSNEFDALATAKDRLADPIDTVSRYRGMLDEQLALAKKSASEAEAMAAHAHDKATAIEQMAAAVEKASRAFGVEAHKSTFGRAADGHDSSSRWWLGASIAMMGALLLLVWSVVKTGPGTTASDIAHYVFVRASLLFIFAFGMLSCLRNYRAHRHLAVVNRHRSIALATFETFVAGSSEEATKSAVLLEATRCIFAPAQTGYVAGDDDGTAGRVVEIVKLASSGGRPNP